MDRELTPKQQTSEAIRQAETILIMTGQHPSIDQVASTIALAALLRKYGKKVTAVVSDEIPAGAKFLSTNLVESTLGGLRDFIVRVDLKNAELDKLKYTIENAKLNIHITPFAGSFQQRDVTYDYGDYQFDLVIILGVASYARIDKIYAQNAELLRQIPLVNIDFHRSNEQYGAINLIEGTAASLSEILIALSESLQSGMIDEKIATTMLAGIMAATDRFTATHTTAKTMTVAAQMMAMGANQQDVVKGLYRDNRSDSRDRKPANSQPPAQRPNPQPVQRTQDTQPQRPAPAQPVAPARPITTETPRPVATAAPQTPQPAPNQVYQQPAAPRVEPPQPTPLPAPETIAPTPQPPVASPLESNNTSAPKSLPRASQPPVTPLAPDAPAMEELLPPHHIEMSDAPDTPASDDLLPEAAPSARIETPTAEPLINNTDDRRPPSVVPRPATNRATNPTNKPVFAQSLDEFRY